MLRLLIVWVVLVAAFVVSVLYGPMFDERLYNSVVALGSWPWTERQWSAAVGYGLGAIVIAWALTGPHILRDP